MWLPALRACSAVTLDQTAGRRAAWNRAARHLNGSLILLAWEMCFSPSCFLLGQCGQHVCAWPWPPPIPSLTSDSAGPIPADWPGDVDLWLNVVAVTRPVLLFWLGCCGMGQCQGGHCPTAWLPPSAPRSPHLTEQPQLAAAWYMVCGRKTVVFILGLSVLPVSV